MYGCVQMYGAVYRCIGHTDIWGDVQGHTDLWGHTRVYRCMEVYTCTGGVYMHGECIGVYKCMGGTQMYGGCSDEWGDVQMYGVYRCRGLYRYLPDIQTARHTPTCLPPMHGYYISYKI